MRDRLFVLMLACCSCFGEADPVGEEASSAADNGSGESGGTLATCADYCALINASCEGMLEQYVPGAACEAVCATFDQGPSGAMSGHSLECRAYHATNAAEDPEGHCRHAGPSGDGVCGGTCESFCTAAMEICTGDNAQWALVDDCIDDCQMFPVDPPYTSSVEPGDSFACRMYHLTLASTQVVPHCSHIALVSPVCNDMPDSTT